MFIFKVSVILKAIERFMPDLYDGLMEIKKSMHKKTYLKVVKSVYRAKAKHLHPDKRTGDKLAFQRLEAAYALVMNDLRKRGKR